MRVLTAEQCREIDRRSAELGTPLKTLMQRAGWMVARAAMKMGGAKISVLCGRGNNGGDGLVAARILATRGYEVKVWISHEGGVFNEACHREWKRLPKSVKRCASAEEALADADLVIDALLGTGASGAPNGEMTAAIQMVNRLSAQVLAVDIPTGIEANTGLALGESIIATRTVTFGGPKPGFFQNQGLAAIGVWEVADIGFERSLMDSLEGPLVQTSEPPLRAPLPVDAHKGSRGRLLIIAGSTRFPGAAQLVVSGALSAGVGYCALAAPLSVPCAIPEAVRIPLNEEVPRDAHHLVSVASRFDAAVIGPGLGEFAFELLGALFPSWKLPTCLDADALNALSMGVAPPKCLIAATPHPAELGRLLDLDTKAIQRDRFSAVRAGAKRVGGSCLLKGPYSLISDQDGPVWVNPTGNPGMATAGMGDVLAGIVGAYLAQGLTPVEALKAAAWDHGAAGDQCAAAHRSYSATEVAAAQRM